MIHQGLISVGTKFLVSFFFQNLAFEIYFNIDVTQYLCVFVLSYSDNLLVKSDKINCHIPNQ